MIVTHPKDINQQNCYLFPGMVGNKQFDNCSKPPTIFIQCIWIYCMYNSYMHMLHYKILCGVTAHTQSLKSIASHCGISYSLWTKIRIAKHLRFVLSPFLLVHCVLSQCWDSETVLEDLVTCLVVPQTVFRTRNTDASTA